MPLQSYPTPGSEARAVSGFQPVNSTQIAFSHYQSPASAAAQAAVTPQGEHISDQLTYLHSLAVLM